MYYKAESDITNTVDALIEQREELETIRLHDYSIDILMCDKEKKSNGMPVLADIRAIRDMYRVYIPYHYVITIYEPNVMDLTEAQMQVLLLHELMHIGPAHTVLNHSVQDFYSILNQFGLLWAHDDTLKPIIGGDEDDC